MRTFKTIIIACLAAGYTASLPSHNANSFEQARSIDGVPNRLLETRTTSPSHKYVNHIKRQLWKAKNLRVPGFLSKVKREIGHDQNPEPKKNIIKGPRRSIPASENNLVDADTDPLNSLEMAYQTALEKTRQGDERDSMITYIREMLPQLSEQAAKDIVDEAVESVVAEDMLNWRDQKESLEQMTYPEKPSISEHLSLSTESEWPIEVAHRMASIKAAEGIDTVSLVNLLQNIFPHLDESQIQEIVAEVTENIDTSSNYDPSGEHPFGEDQPPSNKLKREIGGGNGETRVLDKRTSGPRYFSTEEGRNFGWLMVFTLCRGSLDITAIEEQFYTNFGFFGSLDQERVENTAERLKSAVEADIDALNAVAQFVQSEREGWSTYFQDLAPDDQKLAGLLLSRAVTQARDNYNGLPDLITSSPGRLPHFERDIAELAARAALFILDNPDYSQELQAPEEGRLRLVKRNQSDESIKNDGESENDEYEENEEAEEEVVEEVEEAEAEHQAIVLLLGNIESQIRQRAEAGVQDPEDIVRDMWLIYPFIDLEYLKIVFSRIIAEAQARDSDEANDG